jgi:hypothetical protein
MTHDLKVFKYDEGSLENERRARTPREVSLVGYTDDPGFFVTHEDETAEYPRRSYFCPVLSSARLDVLRDTTSLEVVSREQYERLLKENEAYGQRLKARREQGRRSNDSE